MSDRELLEAAARAAGLPVEFDEGDVNGYWPCGRDEYGDVEQWWNPLTDDGDALRLAVKLAIDIEYRNSGEVFASWRTGKFFYRNVVEEVGSLRNGPEPYAAVRRAIVRAAASQPQNQALSTGGREG